MDNFITKALGFILTVITYPFLAIGYFFYGGAKETASFAVDTHHYLKSKIFFRKNVIPRLRRYGRIHR